MVDEQYFSDLREIANAHIEAEERAAAAIVRNQEAGAKWLQEQVAPLLGDISRQLRVSGRVVRYGFGGGLPPIEIIRTAPGTPAPDVDTTEIKLVIYRYQDQRPEFVYALNVFGTPTGTVIARFRTANGIVTGDEKTHDHSWSLGHGVTPSVKEIANDLQEQLARALQEQRSCKGIPEPDPR